MKKSISKTNGLKFFIGLLIGGLLYVITNGVAFLIPLMLGIVLYNTFLSKYFNHYKI